MNDVMQEVAALVDQGVREIHFSEKNDNAHRGEFKGGIADLAEFIYYAAR